MTKKRNTDHASDATLCMNLIDLSCPFDVTVSSNAARFLAG